MVWCCAIPGCTNGSYNINRWYKKPCGKHGTATRNHCGCVKPYHRFSFPRVPETRNQWITIIRRRIKGDNYRDWQPNVASFVCSMHFLNHDKNQLPTLRLGPIINYVNLHKETQDHSQQSSTVRKGLQKVKQEPHQLADNSQMTQATIKLSGPAYTLNCACIFSKSAKQCCSENLLIRNVCSKYAELSTLLHNQHDSSEQTDNMKTMDTSIFLQSNERLQKYTGLTSKDQFKELHSHLKKCGVDEIRFWTDAKKRTDYTVRVTRRSKRKLNPVEKITTEEELLIVLIKLRLNLINMLLGDMFGVNELIVAQIFNAWIQFMAAELGPLIFWPTREVNKEQFPASLPEHYRNLRCVMDCMEIKIEKPENPQLQAHTWSEYLNRNTVKILVGIAPNGCVSFLSRAWCGNATDKCVIRESGFFEKVECGDLIVAERDFLITEDVTVHKASFEVAPFKVGPMEDEGDKKPAVIRIHMEQSLGRLRRFEILNGILPLSLVKLIDSISTVCAVLTNLQYPLATLIDIIQSCLATSA